MDRSRHRSAWYISLVASGLVVVGLGLWVAIAAIEGRTDPGNVAAFVVAALALAVELLVFFRQRDRPRPSAGEQADGLADIIHEQLLEEVQDRRLRDPWVLPLAWAQIEGSVGDRPEAVVGQARGVVRLNLNGRLEGRFDQMIGQLATGYLQVPSQRLVVLGEPGAGKSVLVLLLTLGLLGKRDKGSPVPVLLAASSWDPVSEEMDEWIVRTLATSYYNGSHDIPSRLLKHDLLLPVVDGLDEIPESGRREAVRVINQTIKRDRPVVVTCRSAEYQDLIRGGAPVLSRAPVVEAVPVLAEDAIAYLEAVPWPAGTRWHAVYERLRERADSPVAEALSTPLMLSLARMVYQRLGGDPAELLDSNLYDSRHAVEDYLTDRVIEAAYAPEIQPSGRPARPSGQKWDATRARRWLTFLAQYMHRHRERDLVWWTMSKRLLSPWVAPAVGISGGVALMTAASAWIALDPSRSLGLDQTLVVAAWIGAGFAVLATVMWYAAMDRPPGRSPGDFEALRGDYGVGSSPASLLVPLQPCRSWPASPASSRSAACGP
jgi:hypothetical protein